MMGLLSGSCPKVPLSATCLIKPAEFTFTQETSNSPPPMSTVSSLPGGKTIAAVKGVTEMIKGISRVRPEWYDETYKWYTRQGCWVLALGVKWLLFCVR